MANLNVITGPQDALLTSARTINVRCTEFADVVKTNPRFEELAVGFNGLIVRIETAMVAKQSSRHTKNVTNEKNSRIVTFTDDLDNLAIIIADMAYEEKNSDWQTRATRAFKVKTKSLSEESLMSVSTEFIAFVRTIDKKMLTHYGVDDAEITDMETQIVDIKSWRLKKEVTVDQKSLDNATLAGLFKQLKVQKVKMEKVATRFIKKNPEFYAAFQKAAAVTLKLGVKTAKAEKEKTPEQLAVEAAKQAVAVAKKEAAFAKKQEALAKKQEAAAKKAEEKQAKVVAKAQKSKAAAPKQATILAGGSKANNNNPASAADNSILEVGKM